MTTPIDEVFEVTSNAGFSHDLQQTLYTYQQQAHLTDFTIHVQDTQIHCHRVILSAASLCFEAMLRAGLEEAEKSKVNLDCLDEEIVNHLIKYFYTGELKVPYHKLADLVSACEFLQLKVLKLQLEKYLVTILDDENCIGWFKLACTYGMDTLAERSTVKMLDNFTSVSKYNEFMELPLAELLDYIQKKKLLIHSEDALLDACIGWVKSDVEKRKENFDNILSHITLTNCSAKYLTDISDNLNELFNSTNIQRRLLNAFQTMSIQYESSAAFQTSDSDKKCFFLCGGDVDENKANKKVFTFFGGKWIEMADLLMDDKNVFSSVCLLKGALILSGGKISPQLCFLYSFSTSNWTHLPAMPNPRYGHASLDVGEKVYILGGWKEHYTFVDTVDVLDTRRNMWHVKNAMQHGVYTPIAVSKDKSIFIIQNSNGGNRDAVNQHGITLQIYDTENDNWRYGASLTKLVSSTRGASAVVHKDDIFLLGGEHMISASYSIAKDSWTILIKRYKADTLHLYGSAVVMDRKIMVLGGSSDMINPDSSQHDYVSEFDLESGRWNASDMKCPMSVSKQYVVYVPACHLMK